MNNYDDIIAGALASNQQTEPVKFGFLVASETDADAYAEAKRVAARTGVPVDTALNMPREMKRQADIGSINFDTLVNTSPTTAALLSDIDRAKLAHDNVDSLSGIETLMRSFKRGLTSGLRGNDASNLEEASTILSLIDQVEAGGKVDINSPYASLFSGVGSSSENLKTLRQTQESRLAENAVEFNQRTRQVESLYPTGPLAQFYSAEGWKDALSRFVSNPFSIAGNIVAESTGLLTPSLPLIVGSGLAGGARGIAASSGVTSANAEYGTAIAEAIQAAGIDVNDQQAVQAFTQTPEFSEIRRQAMIKAGVVGAFDAATSRVAGVRLSSSAGGNLASQTGIQAGGGAAGEALGSLASGQEVNASSVIAEAIGELPGAVVDVASLAGRQIISNTEKAEIAQQGAALLDNLNKLASADKLLARDPATFEQFIAEAAEDGPVQQVFIDAQTLMQSGLANQLASISLAVASQLEPALQSGGQIAIPVEEYATYIAPSDLAPSLLDHLKTEPDGFTRAEAQSFMENRASELEAEVERVLSEKAVDDTFKQSTEAVKLNLKSQLDTAARFTPQVNDAYASMVGNFYGVMAAKLKLTPEELYARFPLSIGAESLTGQVFNQDTPEFRNWFGGSKVVDAEGKPSVVYRYAKREDEIAGGVRFFSKEADYAEAYFEESGQGHGLTAPVYLSLKNPLEVELPAREFSNPEAENPHIEKALQDGNDGVIFRNGIDEFYVAFNPEQIKSAVGNRGTFDPNDPNILHQSGRRAGLAVNQSERTQQAVRKWQDAMLKVRASNPNYIPKLDTPAVLRALGIKKSKLEVPTRYLLEILSRHKDVPENVFYNLPALLSDPIAVVPYKDGGYRVFVDAVTEKGEPVAVGVREDGRIQTITPLHDYQDKTGAERMQEAFDRALGQRGAKVYARNKETLAKAKVSEGAPSGTIPLRRDSHNKAIVVTREQLVKQMGNEFYQEARGAFSPDTNTITLLKNADLSTFLHESGHFFLEVQAQVTSQLQRDASMFGIESLSPGERELLADTDALLKWFGIKTLDEWYALDFEEKRHYHEQFARGFESYLFEGNSPNIEMHGLFQRFRAWMLSVYRDLKALNVELNDEVRGVFDRMLATNEQIALAEQGRSMLPLFNSPEQSGMTIEEFSAYQSLGVEATADAIDDLQKRGLRDMRWIHNARGRVIKQLQDKAQGERAAIKIDVRREVMSQPIYRAWQFLTAKVEGDDRIAEQAKRTSSLNMVDESIDSLFMAVAKLGGIPRAEAQSQWGIDPKERIPMPAFGKHVLRNEGGLSLDSMAEALAQYGYLSVDENGKHNLNDFEDKFFEELRGNAQYSVAYDYDGQDDARSGIVNPDALGAGRFDNVDLVDMGLPTEIINLLHARKMTAKTGLHPDMVAEMFGFSSGDELVRTLAAVGDPASTIESLTDIRMLEEFGELSSQDAIEKAADAAVHNDARARFITSEANALSKATGQTKILSGAAKRFARNMIDRLKVRDIRPSQYANAEVRAAKASEKASRAGDVATAAAEKRNQLIQNHATKAAYDALDEVEANLRYLKKFDGAIKNLDADYADQITGLLERFDLRVSQSNRSVDRRTGLANWINSQREAGFEPDIPPELENEAFRTSYKNLTVEEFRGLVDSVRQIEHLGRLKHKLLTAADNREYEAVRNDITTGIRSNAQDRKADTRTPTTNAGRAVQGLKRFWAAHIKAATWARVMDGNRDGGPVWEYFIRSANERGDMETTMRAEATTALSEILSPIFKMGKMGGKGQYFPSINRSLNRESKLAIALNMGNEGNTQRLLGGEGWTIEQLTPVLRSLSEAEWKAVQAIWDHFETYRPLIAEKERRIYGKEPQWIEPRSFNITTSDGTTIAIKGGYYPIKYDPAASQRAEEHSDAESAKRQLQGAYTTATTRRSFTKARAEEVQGRPLLYTVAGVYSGVNDVIHDLAWHEWLIDANRLLKSQSIDAAMREHYGPEVKQQFKSWVQDIAEGDKGAANAGEMALGRLRQGVSASGLGFNIMSALIQPLGITQSIVRVGPTWIGRGMMRYISNPIKSTKEANSRSSFMENRARTRFRELNELRNKVQDQTAFNEVIGRYAYFLMMRCQQMVDVPTWWGAYEKAVAEGNDEARSVSLADQAVIDAQGGGQTKDLSSVERGGPTLRLFTVFYSFMNTALNLGVAQTMGADTQSKKARLAVDYLLLYTVPAVLGYFWKEAWTPGGDDDDWSELAKKLAAEQLSYLLGLMFIVREFSEASKIITGAEGARDYSGPAGIRGIADSLKLIKQIEQGEFDTAFRKSLINLVGDFSGLPAAQINRTITGTQALIDEETDNPAAILLGFQP